MRIFIGTLAVFFMGCASTAKSPAADQKANKAAFTEFVDRSLVQDKKIKLVSMVLSEWEQVPPELVRDDGGFPGIHSGYYFAPDGRLKGQRGDGAVFTRFLYGANGEIVQTGWSGGPDGAIENLEPPNQYMVNAADWEDEGAAGRPITLFIDNPCAATYAEYEFNLEWRDGLPVGGAATYVRNFPTEYNDSGKKMPAETLYVFLDYEFYED